MWLVVEFSPCKNPQPQTIMTARLFRACVAAAAGFTAFLPQMADADFAPSGDVTRIKVAFTGTEATYSDDLGPFTLDLRHADLTTGPFRYRKTGADTCVLGFTNWMEGDGTYSGSYQLTFTSWTTGTYYKPYTGTFNGYIRGTFELLAVAAVGPPVAENMTVRVDEGKKEKIKLDARGLDYPQKKLKVKIVKKPKVGKLVVKKFPKVIYKPKPGYTGNVRFRYVVREGKSKSKPATVKLKVR